MKAAEMIVAGDVLENVEEKHMRCVTHESFIHKIGEWV
jgi:hypothetical protein